MLPEPKCYVRRCKHYIGVVLLNEADESSEVNTCAAFPQGIPNEIAYGNDPHTEVHPEQDDEKQLVYKELPKYQT